ncbi:MAG: phosphatase PAP2 family protein [Segetibacter sp.]
MQKEAIKTSEKVKGISVRIIIVLAVLAVFIAALYFLTDEIVLEGETAFDDRVYTFFQRFQTPGTTSLMLFFTFFGSIKFLLPAYLLLSCYFIFFKKNSIRSFNVAAIGISSGILLKLIKNIFQRHRPPHPLIENVAGFSYPSGHSFSSFTLAGVIIYILWESQVKTGWKYLGTVLLFMYAALVASSRVYLHVHYASDVLAGFFLSFVWLTICIFILKRINKKGKVADEATD